MEESPSALAEAWAKNWSQPKPAPWVTLFTDSATYTDHAFGFKRTGHSSLTRHHEIWRESIPDFDMTIVHEWKLEGDRYTFRFRATGTFKEDLPRRKATGKHFTMLGSVDFVVVERDGKWFIDSVNEWYNPDFGEVSAENYRIIPEGS